jgi:hypothetical protein
VSGTVALSAGVATVNFAGAAAFTTVVSYSCTAADLTAASAVFVTRNSPSQIGLVGVGTDTIGFICVGN